MHLPCTHNLCVFAFVPVASIQLRSPLPQVRAKSTHRGLFGHGNKTCLCIPIFCSRCQFVLCRNRIFDLGSSLSMQVQLKVFPRSKCWSASTTKLCTAPMFHRPQESFELQPIESNHPTSNNNGHTRSFLYVGGPRATTISVQWSTLD